MNRLLVTLAALTLSGCVMLRSSIDQNLPSIPAGKGIVVFSTGAQETSFAAATGLEVLALGPSATSGGTDIVVDATVRSSDFSDEHGNIRMLVLDAGEYCFQPKILNMYLRYSTRPADVAFRVQNGAVSYIGSIFMAPKRTFQVRDRSERDIPLFLAKNPGLQGQAVVRDPAKVVPECSAAR